MLSSSLLSTRVLLGSRLGGRLLLSTGGVRSVATAATPASPVFSVAATTTATTSSEVATVASAATIVIAAGLGLLTSLHHEAVLVFARATVVVAASAATAVASVIAVATVAAEVTVAAVATATATTSATSLAVTLLGGSTVDLLITLAITTGIGSIVLSHFLCALSLFFLLGGFFLLLGSSLGLGSLFSFARGNSISLSLSSGFLLCLRFGLLAGSFFLGGLLGTLLVQLLIGDALHNLSVVGEALADEAIQIGK